MTSKNHKSILRMVEMAILIAIILVLHFSGTGLRLPFLATPVSLTLIPIALGAMLMGPAAGFFLGLVYGLVVFITLGVMGMDPLFTGILFANNPVMTFLICTLKTSVAGLAAGLVFKALKAKSSILAAFIASAITPVINTGLFILGCLAITDTISANFAPEGVNVVYFIVIVIPGINFIFEFLVNTVFAPALHKLTTVLEKTVL